MQAASFLMPFAGVIWRLLSLNWIPWSGVSHDPSIASYRQMIVKTPVVSHCPSNVVSIVTKSPSTSTDEKPVKQQCSAGLQAAPEAKPGGTLATTAASSSTRVRIGACVG